MNYFDIKFCKIAAQLLLLLVSSNVSLLSSTFF